MGGDRRRWRVERSGSWRGAPAPVGRQGQAREPERSTRAEPLEVKLVDHGTRVARARASSSLSPSSRAAGWARVAPSHGGLEGCQHLLPPLGHASACLSLFPSRKPLHPPLATPLEPALRAGQMDPRGLVCLEKRVKNEAVVGGAHSLHVGSICHLSQKRSENRPWR